jgi:hypothetical protein
VLFANQQLPPALPAAPAAAAGDSVRACASLRVILRISKFLACFRACGKNKHDSQYVMDLFALRSIVGAMTSMMAEHPSSSATLEGDVQN